jgi:hypothetical protein
MLDQQVRLVAGDRENIRIVPLDVRHGAESVVAEVLRRLGGGFVIAALGGLVVPGESDLRPLAAALECPLFLVR